MTKLLFHEIPDAQVVLRKSGVYKQVTLFHRDGRLYAGANGGFVRLGKNGTSVPNLVIDGDMDGLPTPPTVDALGWYEYGEKVSKLRAVR